MKLVAVVAASENDVIGRNNALPWHLPADLAYFRRVTMGKPLLMGRRTYESIGRPLPGRRNLILSRSGFTAPGTETVSSLDEARSRVAGTAELMVIGGAEVFRIALPEMDRIHLTRVHCWIDGDVFMPELPASRWRETAREERAADDRNQYAISFTELESTGPRVDPAGR